jgi:uncharacterized protein (TIGR03790 family)
MKPLTIVLALLLLAAAVHAGGAPCDVLVVVNGNDPGSVAVGEHYRSARAIPARNVVRLDAPTGWGTNLSRYKERIEEPIRDHILREGLRVDYVVCCQGIPILVTVGGGPVSTAALLQLMDTDISGHDRRFPPPPNPYRHGPEAFTHEKAYDGRHLFLVTFLAGFTAGDAKALVDRSVAAERALPERPGFWFQDAGANASGRNRLYPGVVAALREKGFAAEHVGRGADKVRGHENVMVWLSGGSYSGLTEDGVASNRYLPGAIVDMLQSYGAVPRNFDPEQRPNQAPVTWFVRHGITGVHGAVAEPFATAFPDTSLPLRYADGFNLAESFHGSLPYVYWQNLVIGDPLCTPFAIRPTVEAELPESPAGGTIEIPVRTEGPVRTLELRVDGVEVGRSEGASGRFSLDTRRLADGPHEILLVARGPAPLRTAGWLSRALEVRNEELAVLSASVREGRIRARLSRPLAADESIDLAATGPAGPIAGDTRVEEDRSEAVFITAEPLPGGTSIRVTAKGAAAAEHTVIVPPASLALEMPGEVRAGSPVAIRVIARDPGGGTATAMEGVLAVRSSDPPVTLVEGEGPDLSRSVVLPRAGAVTIVAVHRPSGVRTERRVHVSAGEVAGFEIVAPRSVHSGRPFDVRVRPLDRFRNRVEGWRGTLRLVVARRDGKARPLGTVAFDESTRGEATVKGVVLETPGPAMLAVITSANQPVGRHGITVRPARLLSWLLLGPLPVNGDPVAVLERDLLRGEAEVVAGKGSVTANRVWFAHEARRSPIDLGRAAGGQGVVYALCWASLGEGAASARIRLGRGVPVALFVNGRRVFRADAGGIPRNGATIARPGLRPGWNRILVKAIVGKGRSNLDLRIVDGADKDLAAQVRLVPPGGLKSFGVSGRLVAGKTGAPSIRVLVRGPVEREVQTGPDGSFAVGDLPAGAYRVEPRGDGLEFTPPYRGVRLETEGLTGLLFQVKDVTPPRVAILEPEPRAKLGRWFRVLVDVGDNVAVAGVQLLVDGREAGEEVKKAPFAIRADMKPFGSGKKEIRVVARDVAGNERTSDPVEVRIDLDEKPPKIRVDRPRKGKTVVGNRLDVELRVHDDEQVAWVEIWVGNLRLGPRLEAVREVDRQYDIKRVGRGERVLRIVAADTSGNETTVEVPFVKK